MYTIAIDLDQGKVTVSGDIDPAALVKKLAKARKHAEIILPKMQPAENGKGGQKQPAKPPKKVISSGAGVGTGDGKNQQIHLPQQMNPQLMQKMNPEQMQQLLKGFRDMNLPQLKNQTSVKFAPREEEDDDDGGSSEFDDDDFDDDFDDESWYDDDEFEDDVKNVKTKATVNEKKGGAKENDASNKGGGDVSAAKDNGAVTESKNAANANAKSAAIEKTSYEKSGGKGAAAFVGNPMNAPLRYGGGPMAAPQGIHAGGPPPGYFPGSTISPQMMTAANPYQQQYIAAMMQQQQQQRMRMNGQELSLQAMTYARPPAAVSYMPPPPEYTHIFSDENTSSCRVM